MDNYQLFIINYQLIGDRGLEKTVFWAHAMRPYGGTIEICAIAI